MWNHNVNVTECHLNVNMVKRMSEQCMFAVEMYIKTGNVITIQCELKKIPVKVSRKSAYEEYIWNGLNNFEIQRNQPFRAPSFIPGGDRHMRPMTFL